MGLTTLTYSICAKEIKKTPTSVREVGHPMINRINMVRNNRNILFLTYRENYHWSDSYWAWWRALLIPNTELWSSLDGRDIQFQPLLWAEHFLLESDCPRPHPACLALFHAHYKTLSSKQLIYSLHNIWPWYHVCDWTYLTLYLVFWVWFQEMLSMFISWFQSGVQHLFRSTFEFF